MDMKTIFALSVIVALTGLAFVGADSAQAPSPWFTAIKTKADVYQPTTHVCNAFYGLTDNCLSCYNAGTGQGYTSATMKCAGNADTYCTYEDPDTAANLCYLNN